MCRCLVLSAISRLFYMPFSAISKYFCPFVLGLFSSSIGVKLEVVSELPLLFNTSLSLWVWEPNEFVVDFKSAIELFWDFIWSTKLVFLLAFGKFLMKSECWDSGSLNFMISLSFLEAAAWSIPAIGSPFPRFYEALTVPLPFKFISLIVFEDFKSINPLLLPFYSIPFEDNL